MNTTPKKNKATRNAMLLMAVCALLWSTGGLLIKSISCNIMMITASRSFISGLMIFFFMKYKKTPIKITRYSIGAGIGLSVSCFFFVTANNLTTAANAVVLQYTAPIFILIFSALIFKQKLKKKEVITVFIAMLGIVMFFLDQLSPGNVIGNILATLGGAGLAFMFVMIGRAGDDDSVRMSGILIAHTLTTIVGLPFALTGGITISQTDIILIIILGVFQLGLPYVLYSVASKHCPPLACSLIGMLEPLLNPVWVALIIKEIPGTFALVGAAIIITAVTTWCISEARSEN